MKLHDGETMLVRVNREVVRRQIADFTIVDPRAEGIPNPVLRDDEIVVRTLSDPIPAIYKTK